MKEYLIGVYRLWLAEQIEVRNYAVIAFAVVLLPTIILVLAAYVIIPALVFIMDKFGPVAYFSFIFIFIFCIAYRYIKAYGEQYHAENDESDDDPPIGV